MNEFFYPPTRGLLIMLGGMWKRWSCGRRFGHFPSADDQYPCCLRCRAPLM